MFQVPDITIKDVAKRANVSVATVSRVLNGLDRVSAETRKKVLKVIEEMNFVPNTMAASMITKQTQMLAVVVPAIENPFYTAVIQGTVEVAKREGYYAFVFSTNDKEEEENLFFEGSLSKMADGIVLIGAHKEPEFYRGIRKPVVLVDRYIEGSGLDGVVIDNFRGAYEATRFLIENNHRSIAIINGPQDFNDGKERFWGFQQALKDAGLSTNADYLRSGDWFEDNGYESTMQLMRLPNPPTAIFAANNLICQGAIKAIRDLDLVIGEDISLVGFDENELAAFTKPKVAVVKRPTYEMGVHAADRLLHIIKTKADKTSGPQKITLGVELLKSGSVKKLKI